VRWTDGNTDNPRLLFMAYDMTLTAEFAEDEHMAVDNTTLSPATEVRKVLRNGQVLIERGGKVYTITGQELTNDSPNPLKSTPLRPVRACGDPAKEGAL